MTTQSRPFISIVGAPRSGTYLLSYLLYRKLGLAIPSETHFIPLFQRSLPIWGDLRRRPNRRALLEGIFEFQRLWLSHSEKERPVELLRKFSLLAIAEQTDDICSRTRNYPDIVHALFDRFARHHGLSVSADKSAFYEHVPLRRTAAATRSLKVIHIIRDGRDVCLSWNRTWFGPRSVAMAALRWREHVLGNRRWGRQHAGDYLELRYEDLLGWPEQTLARIAEHLSLPLRDEPPAPEPESFAAFLSSAKTHRGVGKPLDPTNRQKWKTQMKDGDVDLFECLAADALRACGYETVCRDARTSSPWLPGKALTREVFSGNFWRRRAKHLLPFFLRCCHGLL